MVTHEEGTAERRRMNLYLNIYMIIQFSLFFFRLVCHLQGTFSKTVVPKVCVKSPLWAMEHQRKGPR